MHQLTVDIKMTLSPKCHGLYVRNPKPLQVLDLGVTACTTVTSTKKGLANTMRARNTGHLHKSKFSNNHIKKVKRGETDLIIYFIESNISEILEFHILR